MDLGKVEWFRPLPVLMAFFLVVLGVSPALSQGFPAGQGVPGGTREEIAPEPRVDPRATTRDDVVPREEREEPAPTTTEDALTFRLQGVNITGSTVYTAADFSELVESFVGTDVTLGSLREIGNRIERKYREDGYVATRVIIPPQAIKDGIPTLEIFEGKIVHYEINGEIGDVKKLIARYLDNLLTDKPARWKDLERYLLISRDLPGISLTGTLRSAGDSAPGGVILVVDAARKAVDGYVNIQNRNAEVTGPWTLSGGLSLNSNTEYGERLGTVGLVSLQEFEPVVEDKPLEQMSLFFLYEHAFGDEGLRLKLSSTIGFAKPGNELAPLKLETDTYVFRAELEYPAIRTREFSLWTRGGVDTADQRAVVAENALFDDQVRAMFLGLSGVWFAPLGGVTEFDVEFRQGFDSFGGRKFIKSRVPAPPGADNSSRADARFDFTIVKGSFSHRQPIPPFFELFFDVRGQYATKPVPSIEEWSLGTLSIGRGYEPGSITGDSGFGVIFEARFTPPGLDLWWLDSLQFYGFMDFARAYDLGNPTNSRDGFEELLSIGFGTRFQVFETVVGDVYVAIPQIPALSTTTNTPDATVHMSLTKFF